MAKSQYFALGDRCLETTSSTGTTINLSGAVVGYRAFSTVVTTNNQRFPYVIVFGSEWEVGYGTRASATSFTRQSSDVLASSTGSLVTFSAGVKEVWIDIPADQIETLTSGRSENLIINGACEVSQEFVNNTQLNTFFGYVCDMFGFNSTGIARFTLERTFGGPPGFPANVKATVTTADPAIGATDRSYFYTWVDGYRFLRASWGNANAESVGFGFWVQASRTGIYTGAFTNALGNRSYTFEYTAVAGQWVYRTVIIPGDITGTWDTTNSVGVYIYLSMASGSNFNQTAGSWQAAARTGTANQTNGTAAIADYMQITGLTLIAGNVAIPAHMAPCMVPPFDQTLAMCHRFYQKSFAYGTPVQTALGTNTGEYFFSAIAAGPSPTRSNTFPFRTRMIFNPSMAIYNPALANSQVRDETTGVDCTLSTITGVEGGFHVATTTDAGALNGYVLGFHWSASSRF